MTQRVNMPGRIVSPEGSTASNAEEKPPVLPVSSQPIVCVEHPCIIKSLDRGISSMGGENVIDRLFDGGRNPDSFEISLRPDDVMAKTLLSKKVDVKQLLLKVTVPKRTGRRRRRGTNGPFLPATPSLDGPQSANAHQITKMDAEICLRSLRDNKADVTVGVIGKIGETHRFRSMPDFQYATTTSSLMRNLRSSICTTDFPAIRDFKYDMSKQLPPDQDVGPPPFFSTIKQPFNYYYKQNPHVQVTKDANGNIMIINASAPVKHIRHNIEPDAESVPSGPPAELPPLETTSKKIQDATKELKRLFEERPLMQRRVLVNLFKGKASENEFKAAVGYCGYAFTSGPWRDTVIKFGIDPRKDPKYRVYQTASFQLSDDSRGAADDPGNYIRKVGGKRVTSKIAKVDHSHVFDGSKFYKDGKVWQACDVTDPVLKEILSTTELKDAPDMIFSGWYGNGTWSLFRRIMKYKIGKLALGHVPDDDMCRAVAAMFPAFVDESNVHLTRVDEPNNYLSQSDYADYTIEGEASTLASEVRATAVAAYRYRNKHFKGRTSRRASTASRVSDGGDVEMLDADDARAKAREMAKRVQTPFEEDDDEALIGLDSGGEEEDEDEDNQGGDDRDDD